MADNFPHSEFWLPPEFLTDDDILTDFIKPVKNREDKMDSVLNFPCFLSRNGLGKSGLSSPGESSIGSEESEEDDCGVNGLAKKLANCSVFDDLWKTETHKNWGISVSPQSTLSGFNQGSSRNSPNCPSPPAGADRPDPGWELLYAAAGEVARMRMMEEANAHYRNRGLKTYCYSTEASNPNLGFRLNQSVSYEQLQIAKFQQLRREQLIRHQQALHVAQQQAAKARSADRQPAKLSPVTWPTLHQSFQPQPPQQPATSGSGLRAVFLRNNAVPRRESTGTGVFIPRGAGIEPRKNSGCSTVLLPDRVVQALNLNLEAMDTNSRLNNALASDLDKAIAMRSNVLMEQQQQKKKNFRSYNDLRLPQEWTY